MPITIIPNDAGSLRLQVDGAMTVYEAGAQKTELMETLAGAKAIEIDLAGIDEIDTAGLQLLALTRREGHRAGKPVYLLDPSGAVLEAMDCFGLGSWMQEPGADSSCLSKESP